VGKKVKVVGMYVFINVRSCQMISCRFVVLNPPTTESVVAKRHARCTSPNGFVHPLGHPSRNAHPMHGLFYNPAEPTR
jgi:hypothetical protein